jgi:anti-sigma B factor antagonist
MEASFTVINHRSDSGCCEVIELAGELDVGTAHGLEAILDRMVISKHIIVDASRLTFIDSTGLHLLLRASNLVEGRIWIKGASRHVSRVLEVSGVSQFFCLEQDPMRALRTIAHRPTPWRAGSNRLDPNRIGSSGSGPGALRGFGYNARIR